MKKLILLSGGLDSALCLHRYGADLAVGFDYGQPHVRELDYAQRLAKGHGVPFLRCSLPAMAKVDDVVFAGRNALLLTAAASMAQARGIGTVVIGCNFSDAERFADCRPAFIRNLSRALEEAYGVSVAAPLLTMTKAQIVQAAREAGLPATWTCYAPTGEGTPCGQCHACVVLAQASAA